MYIYIYIYIYIYNTKITCRIHLIAPRHAFRFELLHNLETQCTFSHPVEMATARRRESKCANKDHVALILISLSLQPVSRET